MVAGCAPGRKVWERARAENYFEDYLWFDFAAQDELRYSRPAEAAAPEGASGPRRLTRKLSAPAAQDLRGSARRSLAPDASIHGESQRCGLTAERLPFASRRGRRSGAQNAATEIGKAWRSNERRLWLRQVWNGSDRLFEVQRVSKISHVAAGVPRG